MDIEQSIKESIADIKEQIYFMNGEKIYNVIGIITIIGIMSYFIINIFNINSFNFLVFILINILIIVLGTIIAGLAEHFYYNAKTKYINENKLHNKYIVKKVLRDLIISTFIIIVTTFIIAKL